LPAVVRQRVDDGFYTEDQAAELFELLDERMSVMEEVDSMMTPSQVNSLLWKRGLPDVGEWLQRRLQHVA